MFDSTLYEDTAISPAGQQARAMIHSKIKLGQEVHKRLLAHCAQNIPRDRYVRPSAMGMQAVYKPDIDKHVALLYPGDSNKVVKLHKNALGQMADTCGLPRVYVTKLHTGEAWREQLLATNLNELFGHQEFRNRLKEPAEFLHRLVGGELRGFLTQSYNRHLLSMPLLVAFKQACDEFGATPAHGYATDTKVGLQCYLPYAFEPVKNEFVAIGVWWGNSDFGDGKLKVSHTLMRVNGWGSAIMEDSYSRVHLGGVVRDSDIRLSDEVAAKEIDTVAAAIRDTVSQALHPDRIKRLCDVIAQVHSEEIPWDKLKGQLGKLLNREQVEKLQTFIDQPITDLPPPGMDQHGNPLASKWWAAAAVALLAEHETDQSKQADLKLTAGKFLGEAA
jgi:hypothetical protein